MNLPAAAAVQSRDGVAVAVAVQNVSKLYKVYSRPKDLIIEAVTGKVRHHEQWALRDVSFTVAPGEVVGIIGPNGAGKSTLLKIITGTLTPTSGKVLVNGRVSAILELGTGFHPEYSGRQNVITGGMCLGMTREQIDAKLPWILEFSELEHVIDLPFKTYSSGMQARLTFATAISVEPEVLIIDEALAAGDAYFVNKCMQRMREICKSGATVLLVSHGTNQIAQMCETAVWLDDGKVRMIGPAREVTKLYDYEVHVRVSNNVGQIIEIEAGAQTLAPSDATKVGNQSAESTDTGSESEALRISAAGLQSPDLGDTLSNDGCGKSNDADGLAELAKQPRATVNVYRKGPIVINRVVFRDGGGRPTKVFRTWDSWRLDVDYECAGEIPEETLGLSMTIERERDLMRIAQFNTVNPAGNESFAYDEASFRRRAGRKGTISAVMPSLQMLEGEYILSVSLQPNIPGLNDYYEYHQRLHRFQVIPAAYPSGAAFYPIVEWRHELER